MKREMVAEAGGELSIPDVDRFDSNIITPVSTLPDKTTSLPSDATPLCIGQPPTSMQADTSHDQRLLQSSVGIVVC